ncbi:MAG: hypothetical protein GY723_21620 [bacterium]|nr:hypothetical protein [bacterium]MCP5067165.1 hypothetical protein [bacterium]
MSDNPYAPPSADVEAPTDGLVQGTGDFGVGQCVSDAWSATWAGFPVWLGAGIMATLMLLGSAVTVIGIFLVWPVLFYGVGVFLLGVQDGRADSSDLWAGFRNYGSTLGNGLAFFGLMAALSYLGQIPIFVGMLSDSVALTVAGQLINIIWAFVLVRFYFAFFIWVEHRAGPVEAIGQSWAMTRPVMWKMIGLMFVMGAIYAVPIIPLAALMIPAIASDSAALLGLGAILTIVLMTPTMMIGYLLWASAYRQVAGRPEATR